jgi:hypothetical protein
MTLIAPVEEIEQANFVQWLEIKGYKFTAIPNSTYTRSYAQKRKNTRTGLRAGFPDMIVIAEGKFMAIELKRTVHSNKGTPEQIKWIEALNNVGVPAKVCRGCEEAIEFVKHVVNSK